MHRPKTHVSCFVVVQQSPTARAFKLQSTEERVQRKKKKKSVYIVPSAPECEADTAGCLHLLSAMALQLCHLHLLSLPIDLLASCSVPSLMCTSYHYLVPYWLAGYTV